MLSSLSAHMEYDHALDDPVEHIRDLAAASTAAGEALANGGNGFMAW
jgi:hypothetical protein